MKETVPNPNWPTWCNCTQILSASSSPNHGGSPSSLAAPPPLSAATPPPLRSPLRPINFLFCLLCCRHRRPIIHGSLTRARAKKLTTEHGHKQMATQSATKPVVHDWHCLPEQSIRSAPSSTANLCRRVGWDEFFSMFEFSCSDFLIRICKKFRWTLWM